MNTLNRIRQLQYPREFRIAPPALDTGFLKNFETLVNNLTQTQGTPANKEERNEAGLNFIIDIAIGVWRMKKKMIDPATKQPLIEMKKAYRHLESVIYALEKEKIEIQDHDNDGFESGLSLKVLAFQPTPGLTREIIIETVKPTIYYKGERILLGEVIVGSPVE